jgi:hypothetical protein
MNSKEEDEELVELLSATQQENSPAIPPPQDERRDAFNVADPELNDLLNLVVEIYAEGGNHDSAEYMMELLGKVEARLETNAAQNVSKANTPEQQPVEQWQVRYLPGQKVEERWWQDSTAERAAWCAEANAQQLAKGLPDVWEIRKLYAAPIARPEQPPVI